MPADAGSRKSLRRETQAPKTLALCCFLICALDVHPLLTTYDASVPEQDAFCAAMYTNFWTAKLFRIISAAK
jgi:hypothetical protein